MPPMTGQQAYDSLFEVPIDFLGKHKLRIQMGEASTGVFSAWMFADGTIFNGHDSYVISGSAAGTNPYQISVFYVRVYHSNEVVKSFLESVPLPTDADRLLVTVALTGCSVVYQGATAGGPFVTHIKPVAGQAGEQLQQQLQGAHFLASPTTPTSVFGRDNYPHPGLATVIGRCRERFWALYAQVQDATQIKKVFYMPLF